MLYPCLPEDVISISQSQTISQSVDKSVEFGLNYRIFSFYIFRMTVKPRSSRLKCLVLAIECLKIRAKINEWWWVEFAVILAKLADRLTNPDAEPWLPKQLTETRWYSGMGTARNREDVEFHQHARGTTLEHDKRCSCGHLGMWHFPSGNKVWTIA